MPLDMKSRIDRAKRLVDRSIGRLEGLAKELERAEDRVAKLAEEVTVIVAAHTAINTAAMLVQNEVYQVIDQLATRCVQFVFGPTYEVVIEFEEKRGKTEATVLLRRDGREMSPMDSVGGGVVDVIAFSLRLAAVLLRSDARKLLVLDEPFKFVSADRRPYCAQLLMDLAEELDFQIIIVTHDADFVMGDVIEIEGDE